MRLDGPDRQDERDTTADTTARRTRPDRARQDTTAERKLIEQLRSENAFLRAELKRRDAVIQVLVQRQPEQPSPPAPSPMLGERRDPEGRRRPRSLLERLIAALWGP